MNFTAQIGISENTTVTTHSPAILICNLKILHFHRLPQLN